MPTTEFCLIRHGETAWNIRGLYQGSSDEPLNEHGIAQATALGRAMHGETWDVVVSSPLLRALRTAQIVAEAIGFPGDDIETDARLQERSYGVAEGMTLEDREIRYPGDTWEGFENDDALHERIRAVMADLAARYPGKRVMVVTHSRWMIEALRILSDGEIAMLSGSIPNTSRTYLTHDANGWQVGAVGVADHLGGLNP